MALGADLQRLKRHTERVAVAQRAIFLETAHPFIDPTLLDVVQQIPGWAAVFTDGFTGAMVILAAVTAVGTPVAFLGLRGSGGAQAPVA